MLRAIPSTGERGFTLIELLISMIIVVVLLAAFTSFLLSAFGNSEKANQESSAIQQVTKSVTSFSSDLQRAKSPDREETQLGDPGLLSDALLNGTPLKSVNSAGQTVTLDVSDIVSATSTSFTFRADVLPRPGVECVRYWVTAGPKPALMREVSAYQVAPVNACSPTPLVQDQLIAQVR